MFTNVAAEAPWRHCRINHEQFVASCPALSPWFLVPGMRLELVFFDLMHIGPLGIFRSLAAGIIWNMVQRGELRNVNEELSLRLLWQDFRQWCRNHKLAPPSGTLSKRLIGDFRGKLHGLIFGSMEAPIGHLRRGFDLEEGMHSFAQADGSLYPRVGVSIGSSIDPQIFSCSSTAQVYRRKANCQICILASKPPPSSC